MKLKKITIKDFKRFTDLTVEQLPESARLIVLAGPNGSGKSSFFDALNTWHRHSWRSMHTWQDDYHRKISSAGAAWNTATAIEFHDPQPKGTDAKKTAIYIRSAYRHEPEFVVRKLARTTPLKDENRFARLIEADQSVSRNYARLASQSIEAVFEKENPDTKIGEFREKIIGKLRDAMAQLFPDVTLNSLGNPLEDGTFKFSKGASNGFTYKNLSGGEKAAFDIILDFVVATHDYRDTIFCIDEPEIHMHAKLQAKLLTVMLDLLPDNCQLVVATHSIGMTRCARDISKSSPGSVVFLDFGNRDFDLKQTITPAHPTRAFWQSMYEIALDDLAALVAPTQVVICEGDPKTPTQGKNAEHDARCYDKIFQREFPETRFLSAGNSSDVTSDRLALAASLAALIDGIDIIRIVDRDDKSESEIADDCKTGVRVLGRRNIESYLLDDEVLTALCETNGATDKIEDLLKEKEQLLEQSKGAQDDLKPIGGALYVYAKKLLGLVECGNTKQAFMRDTLAPLITLETNVYAELRDSIFGPN